MPLSQETGRLTESPLRRRAATGGRPYESGKAPSFGGQAGPAPAIVGRAFVAAYLVYASATLRTIAATSSMSDNSSVGCTCNLIVRLPSQRAFSHTTPV